MTAPVSLIVSAFAPVGDAAHTLTPQPAADPDAVLVLIDLGRGRDRLGASALAQVYGELGDQPPDIDDPADLRAFFELLSWGRARAEVLAYHDRSDGGLIVTLLEMAFAGRCGLDIRLPADLEDALAYLFNEEAGAVLQLPAAALDAWREQAAALGLDSALQVLGHIAPGDEVVMSRGNLTLLRAPRSELQAQWAATSHALQRLRDNPECADEEHARIAQPDPGLHAHLSFTPQAPFVAEGLRPRVAVLREQGVNGQVEMAAAFDAAGFDAVDVHMSDLSAGRVGLDDFSGLVACGGFSYGDVLGAGEGWAKSILFNARLRDEFAAFLAHGERFALGVCNGCQMLSVLRDLIPGSECWPRFRRNRSEQFEARLSMVEVQSSPSIFLDGMAGSRLPIAVAHGEGRAVFDDPRAESDCEDAGLVGLRYIENSGSPTQRYPANPNGSTAAISGVSNGDGRVTIMMPHPERVIRTLQFSWAPQDWGEYSPWLQLFRNARRFLG